jgi:uncharacterized protein YjbI with pentapeptide repeats
MPMISILSLVVARFRQSWRWLMERRDPITWTVLRARLTTLPLLPSRNAGRFAVLAGIVVLLLLVSPWYAKGHKDKNGVITYPNAALINPILAGLGAILLIYAAIRQAQTAGNRHEAQTKADLQRRITESFSKAVEQLGSDKLEVRLGGIYALERISQECTTDYWTVMENLTAFVRERTQRAEADRRATPLDQRVAAIAYLLWEEAGKPERRSEEFWHVAVERATSGEPPATDIAAVLTVIKRRSETHRAREVRDQRVLDFRGAVLRRADLTGAHLEGANLWGAHLERAVFIGEDAGLKPHLGGTKDWDAYFERMGAHLEGANLWGAHLERALLGGAHLQRAICIGANLEGANLIWARLDGADLAFAHLEYANLIEAHLDGAQLWAAEGLTQAQIDQARGDAATTLPPGLTRPAHWTNPDRGEGSAPAA